MATVKSIERMIEKNEGESTVFENIIKEAQKQDTSIKKYVIVHYVMFFNQFVNIMEKYYRERPVQ